MKSGLLTISFLMKLYLIRNGFCLKYCFITGSYLTCYRISILHVSGFKDVMYSFEQEPPSDEVWT